MELAEDVQWTEDRLKTESQGRAIELAIPQMIEKPEYGYPHYNSQFRYLTLEDGNVDERIIEIWPEGTGDPQKGGMNALHQKLIEAGISNRLIVAGEPQQKLLGSGGDSSEADDSSKGHVEDTTKIIIDTRQDQFDAKLQALMAQHQDDIIKRATARIVSAVDEYSFLGVAPEVAQGFAKSVTDAVQANLTPLKGSGFANKYAGRGSTFGVIDM